jgi:2-polyprenyl-3-methyl-5-hydroxy-6-metoxy-1,4-benzoquinol methylase
VPACPLCGAKDVVDFLTAPDRFHLRRERYKLMQCNSCWCVWLASPPKPCEMAFHYSENYHKAIVTGAEHTGAERWRSHRSIVGCYRQRGAILDIGCSSGSFLASMNNGAWNLYGIEMNGLTAEEARSKSGAEVFVGDVMDAPFQPNSFDVVTCFDVLEHVYQPREFLERVLYWLRPGGILFAKMPNIDSWEARLFGTYWYGLELPRHLYHFSPRSLRPLVRGLGFHEVCIKATGKGTHLGHSVRYLYGDLLKKFGFSPIPMSETRQPSLVWRIVRKALMLSLFYPLSQIPSVVNAGVVIDVILKKEA